MLITLQTINIHNSSKVYYYLKNINYIFRFAWIHTNQIYINFIPSWKRGSCRTNNMELWLTNVTRLTDSY